MYRTTNPDVGGSNPPGRTKYQGVTNNFVAPFFAFAAFDYR